MVKYKKNMTRSYRNQCLKQEKDDLKLVLNIKVQLQHYKKIAKNKSKRKKP